MGLYEKAEGLGYEFAPEEFDREGINDDLNHIDKQEEFVDDHSE